MIQVETHEQVFEAVSMALDKERVDLVAVTQPSGVVVRIRIEAIRRVFVRDPSIGGVAFEGVVVDKQARAGLRPLCPTCGR